MARPRRAFTGGGSRRLTQWLGPADQGYISVASGGATLTSSASFEEAATIVRSRGNVSIRPNAFTADVALVGAFGVAIVSTEAFNAGVTAIPEPFTDSDWGGWMVWRSFTYFFQFSDATGAQFNDWNFEVDSKAMRKLSPNETLVQIAESQGGAFQISTPLRHLIKLS